MILPVVSKRLVEGPILLLRDVRWVTCPNRLGLVELLVNLSLFLNLLLFLLLGLFIVFVINLLNLRLALFVFTLFDLFFVIVNLLRCVIRDS